MLFLRAVALSRSRLRIVFVLPVATLAGGIRTVAIYADYLRRQGHRVTVVSSPLARPTLREQVRSLRRGMGWLRAPRPPPSHLDAVEVDHRRIDRVRPIVDGDVPDADVVIATWWETAEWVAALSPSKGVKVYFLQGHEVDVPGQPVERVAATWHLPLHKIVVSRWLQTLSKTRYGDPAAAYVPCGVDAGHFRAAQRIRQPVPTVGMLYTLERLRGCDIALEGVRCAARMLPELRLVAFGIGPPSPALPLPHRADYLQQPEQTSIPAIYARCDAWIWASRAEGFGLPLLEAMACGTPLIATPAGAAPELVEEGGGMLVPSEDPEALGNAIVRVCRLPDAEWQEWSARARAAATRHPWESSARLFEEALWAAFDRGGPPA